MEERLGSTLGLAVLNTLLAELLLGESRGIRVETEHDLLVAEGVLLLDDAALGAGLALGSVQDGLDLGGVDEAGDVRVGDHVVGQGVVLLQGGGGGSGAVDLVESLEGGGGPDDEATEVTAGSELEEVEAEDGCGLNTGDVAESTHELLAVDVGVVDDERTAALAETAVPELTLTGAHGAGLLDLDELRAGAESLQESNGGLGLGESGALEGLGVNDQRNFGDVGDAVAAGEKERRDGRSSEGRSGSEAPVVISLVHSRPLVNPINVPLANVDLLVPLPPDLGGSEHATGAALVTESSLTSTVSTATRDTRDTSDSATWAISFNSPSNFNFFSFPHTGTPGLSGGLFTSLLAHGIRLSLVLRHTGVNLPVG